ncbi:MAG: glycosyltransferase, partial [Candidatus Peribacteraceae bacterium]|nr:glycosyltransferase [Candidatus Peribacteraceae bacterium]
MGTARETLPAATHTISIVIPAHNEEQYLGACLESIVRQRTASGGDHRRGQREHGRHRPRRGHVRRRDG